MLKLYVENHECCSFCDFSDSHAVVATSNRFSIPFFVLIFLKLRGDKRYVKIAEKITSDIVNYFKSNTRSMISSFLELDSTIWESRGLPSSSFKR